MHPSFLFLFNLCEERPEHQNMIPDIITLSSLLQVGAEPFKTLVKTVSRGGTGGLDVLERKDKLVKLPHSTVIGEWMMGLPRLSVSSCGGRACR